MQKNTSPDGEALLIQRIGVELPADIGHQQQQKHHQQILPGALRPSV